VGYAKKIVCSYICQNKTSVSQTEEVQIKIKTYMVIVTHAAEMLHGVFYMDI
jgi:hypothetical protein